MFKRFRSSVLISTILFFITFPFGAIGHHFVLIVASMGYATVAFFFLNDHSSKKDKIIKFAILLAYPTILLTPIFFIDFDSASIAFPSTLSYFLGSVFGACLYKVQRFRIVMISVYGLSIYYAAFIGYDYWIHKTNFNTYLGNVEEPEPEFELLQADGKKISSKDFKNKTVVLDFWNTACGICFQQFPHVAELKSKLEGEASGVVFYTVNVPLKRDTPNRIFKTAAEIPYDFRHLFAKNTAEAVKFGVHVYPTIVVLKNQKIIFRGSLANLSAVIEKAQDD